MQKGPAKRTDAWRVIGPGGGGTMLDPTISPHDSDLVVEHCDMTGAYITTDGGESWRMFNLGSVVRTFAFDPSDPKVIYAGSYAVWRSEDRGATWRMVLPDPARNTVAHMHGDHADCILTSDDPAFPGTGYNVIAIAVDPSDSEHLYAIWQHRSKPTLILDGKAGSWSVVAEKERGPIHAVRVSADGSRLYLVTPGGVCVLSQGRWQERAGPNDEELQYAALGAGEGKEPFVVALPARAGRWQPYGRTVHVSADGGETWEDVTPKVRAALTTPPEGTAHVYRMVACQDENGEVAYLGFTLFAPEGKQEGGAAGVRSMGIIENGLLKTMDGGAHWELVFREANGPAKNHAISWIERREPDSSVWLEGPLGLGVAPADAKVCYATDLFRTYRTRDGGKTWETVNSVDCGGGRWTTRGLDVTTNYGVHFDPFDVKHVFISYTDIGPHHSRDGGKTWRGTLNGIPDAWRNTSYWIELDPEMEGLVWSAFSSAHDLPRPKMWRSGRIDWYQGGVAVSTDGGESWTLATKGMPETAVTHILLDPTSPVGSRTLYVCGYGLGVFKSVDNGCSWTQKNNGLEGTQPFVWRITRADDGTLYLLVARRSDDGSIGTPEDGALYRSFDGAESWEKMALPEGCNGPTGLTLDPQDNTRMYLAAWGVEGELDDTGGGVFLSTDAGKTWRNVLSESQHAYDVTVDRHDPKVLYVCGFDQAAYRSSDRGETWSRMKGYNFKWGHRVFSDPLDPGKVYVCTYGGSVWHGPAVGDPEAVEDTLTPLPTGNGRRD